MVEQPLVFGTVRSGVGAGTQARAEQGPEGESMASSHSSPEEKFSDNISSASEASETTSGSEWLRILSIAFSKTVGY